MDNITDFVDELGKLRTSSTFLTLKGYQSESGEIADFNIVFHMSYKSALEKSIEVLKALDLKTDLEKMARKELLESFNKSLTNMANTPIQEVDDAYTRFFDDDGNYIKGVKLHTATETLHLYGLVVHKRVRMPGSYAKVNHKPLTEAKNKLRFLCPVGRFRQFRLTPSQVDRITVENISLLPPE